MVAAAAGGLGSARQGGGAVAPGGRALEVAPPAESGRGRRPTRPWHNVAAWSPSRGAEAWRRIDGREGAKGPLGVEAGKRRVGASTPRRQQGDAALVGVRRSRARDTQQGRPVDEALSTAVPETPLGAWARVAHAAHRSAACLQRSTSKAGVAEDEGRHWTGWQQQHTRAFLATWCLRRATQRGKKMDPCDDLPPDAPRHRNALA